MEGGISGLIATIISGIANAVFIIALALGLSSQDIKIVIMVAFGYSFIGFVLSQILPEILYKKGILTEREKKLYSLFLVTSWIIAIWFVFPKLKYIIR